MTLHEKLQERRKLFATTLTHIGWSGIVEILAGGPLDFLILDLEHGCLSPETVENLIRAASGRGLEVVVRAPDSLYHLLSPLLDVGAAGVLVPRVESVEQARLVAQCLRFPPRGRKGFGGFSLLRPGEDLERLDRQRSILLQIETPRGIGALEAILDLGEFSGIVVGPSDLSIALGVPLQYDHPRLVEAAGRVLEICRSRGTSCGIYCPGPGQVRFWRGRGMNILWTGSDTDYLARGYRETCDLLEALE